MSTVLPKARHWRAHSVGYALFAYVALFAAYTLFGPGRIPHSDSLEGLGQIPPVLAAALLCGLAARGSSTKRRRWSWGLISAAGVCALIAEVTYIYLQAALQTKIHSPAVADALWMIYFPLAFAGLTLQTPKSQGSYGAITSALDALIFTVAVAGLSWWFLLTPSLAKASDLTSALINLSWPAGDLLLVFAMASLMLRTPLDRAPAHLFYLVGAIAVKMITDTTFTVLVMDGSYATGHPIDALWPLAQALVGVAALSWLRNEQTGEIIKEPKTRRSLRRSARVCIFLPYLALPAAALLLYYAYFQPTPSPVAHPGIVLIIAIGLLGLAMLRQFLTLRENKNLSLSLTSFSHQLEARVEQRTEELTHRTAELAALNQVATQLSQCLTSGDVLTTGLKLACEATGSIGGVIWLPEPDGRTPMVGSTDVSAETKSFLMELPKQDSILEQALRNTSPVVLRKTDLLSYPWSGQLASHAPSSLVIAPLLSRRTVLGAMGLVGNGEPLLSQIDLQLYQSIGAEVGVALENSRRYEDAKYLADRDPVTGLLNHRAIHQRLDQELKRAQRGGHQASIIMMDLDEFKLFNDTYGHPTGDQVLRQIATILLEQARGFDLFGRYGGDEFMAILPETDTESAVAVAKRLRSVLASQPYLAADRLSVPIRMSFGIAGYPRDGRVSHELVGFADANLYESKRVGGDTITTGSSLRRNETLTAGAFGVLDGLLTAVDNKDHYTRQHSEDVTCYAIGIAKLMRLPEDCQRTLRLAGLLHDVGKIGVPDRILRKPGKLDDEEFAIVKQHALLGEMIIKDVPNIIDVLAAVGAHHERFDGKGYPRGMKDGEIPMLGRILAVADAYSAMTTDRPYRKALSTNEAKAELRRSAGTQLDPELVEVFLRFLEESPPAALAS